MSTAATLALPLERPLDPNLSEKPTLHVIPATGESVQTRRDRIDLEELFNLSQPPGYYSEPSRVALLRRTRRRPHDQLLVDFSADEVLTELTAAGRVLWCSSWQWQATIDGSPLVATGPWRELCWHTDRDVDYLEIELSLSGGWRLQRQFVLARKDRFVLLADALLGPRPHDGNAGSERARPMVAAMQTARPMVAAMQAPEIRYAATIGLAPGIDFAPAAKTREGWLQARRKRCATVVPLALPEWRAERCHSELMSGLDGTLVLTQAAAGHALLAPLWIDLDSRRARQPLTWRRLTVAENLQALPREVAAGYRVQIGDGQWLAYRTLAPRGNRTVLGQNFSSDFVCCRLRRSGAADTIIEIQ